MATRRTSLAITLIVGTGTCSAGHRTATAFVPSPPPLVSSPNGASRACTIGGRREDIGTADNTCNRLRPAQPRRNGPLHMFVGFQDDRTPRNHELGRPSDDPYGREDFRGIHSHDIPWREHMPNAANDDASTPTHDRSSTSSRVCGAV